MNSTLLEPEAVVLPRNFTVNRAVSLVIPAFNEEPIIRQAVREAARALNELQAPYEIIVVDDGSTDGTAAAALAEAVEYQNVQVVSLPQNQGYTAALQFGFSMARFDLVAFTDADCQFDLRDLARLLPLAAEADLVCGYRVRRQDAWRRCFLSGGFNVLARTLLGTGVRDCDCALKLIPRDWVNSQEFSGGGFFFNAELLGMARMDGLKVVETGVAHRPRGAGESKVSLGLVLPVFVALVRFWWCRVLFPAAKGRDVEIQRRSFWMPMVIGSLVLAAVSALVLVPGSSFPLMSPDEARYAEIARTMLDSRDFIVPRRMDQPYLDKPPLLYWVTAASYWLFGTSIDSVRIVPMVAAMLTVLCTFWLGTPVVGRRQAWLGSILLLCCAGFLLSGRFLYMDTLLTLFTTITSLAAFTACRGPQLQKRYWILAAVACGLGILTKGPVIVALCLPPIVAICWLTKCERDESRRHRLTARDWLIFAGVAALVAAPWFVAINFWNGGGTFVGEFLWTHHLARFFGGLSHQEPWWFYIPVLLVCTLPCSVLYPAVIAFVASRHAETRRERTRGLGYTLLSAVWILTVFTLSRCKLPPYLLPLVPLSCLATGTALNSIVLRSPANEFLAYVQKSSPRDLLAILAIVAVVMVGLEFRRLDNPSAMSVLSWAGIALLGTTLLAVFIAQRLSVRSRWATSLAYLLIVAAFGVGTCHSELASRLSVVKSVAALRSRIDIPPRNIVCFSIGRIEDAIAFEFQGCQIGSFQIHECDAVIADLQSRPATMLLAKEKDVFEIARRLPPQLKLNRIGNSRQIAVLLCRRTSELPPRQPRHVVRR